MPIIYKPKNIKDAAGQPVSETIESQGLGMVGMDGGGEGGEDRVRV